MSQVKVFVTDRGTDGQTDRQMNEIYYPLLSRKAGDNKGLCKKMGEFKTGWISLRSL